MNALELTGRTRTHVVQLGDPRCALHHQVVEPFLALRAAAARDAIDLYPFSSFRDFDAQVSIWNKKLSGEKTIYDVEGHAVDIATLDIDEALDAILRWSALPGASRHHWGSEIDVIDQAAMPPGYRLQLLAHEYESEGVFNRLGSWLKSHAQQFGFFCPYNDDRGGVGCEPWHISYADISVPALAQLSIEMVHEAIVNSQLSIRQSVLVRLPEIMRRYVYNVATP